MSGFFSVSETLRATLGDRIHDLRPAGSNQWRLVMAPTTVPELAVALRQRFGAELWLMVGDDRRSSDGRFEVHYLFAQSQENWFVHATAPVTADNPAFGIVEGWRGAITHWLMAGADGRLQRVKVLDPSFLNWRPLSYALLGNIVPDFPLCNKSFNQSYSGNDL